MAEVIQFLLVGLGIGAVVGALGAGGGILSLPALSALLGLSALEASTGSLVVVGITALVSLLSRVKSGQILWREGSAFGFLGLAGAAVGAKASFLVPEPVLLTLFAALLLLVSIATLRHRAGDPSRTAAARRGGSKLYLGWLILAATGTGLLTGFFGVGGGFIIVPALVLLFHASIRQAASTSVLVMVIVAAASLATRLGGDITLPWLSLIIFAFASAVGALIGRPLSQKFSDQTLTRAFALLLQAIAVLTLVQLYC